MEENKIVQEESLLSREECEKQLAVELALGAVDDIDSLIKKKHEVALEYACQSLFESSRKKVADLRELPRKIVKYLYHDRNELIRTTAILNNWEVLNSKEQQETVLEIEDAFKKLENPRRYPDTLTSRRLRIVQHLFIKALLDRNEEEAIHYFRTLHIVDRHVTVSSSEVEVDFVKACKEMPKFLKVYWDEMEDHLITPELILAHPNEDLRLEKVQHILDKKTTTRDLRRWGLYSSQQVRLKTLILKKWKDDPSKKIRKYIVEHTTGVEALQAFENDTDPTIASIAQKNRVKYERRRAYSRAYHNRKKNW